MMSEFSIGDLKSYIDAVEDLKDLNSIKEKDRERIFDSCYRQMDVGEYGMYSYATSTEDAALLLVEIDKNYEKLLVKLKRKSKMLIEALERLSAKEIYAFHVVVWKQENFMNMSTDQLKKYLESATQKLCRDLYIQKQKYLEQKEKERKAKLRADIEEYKGLLNKEKVLS